ncbi:glycosyltransferase family 2 protein [Fredinandcohnia onubensis]|uniref:glycosyltransferase family 2 protein n=1 Tax=Fredinandcohnia onubensis TaxID=1571209 RepID=UPI000C0BB986|nr:glycosyltransferase family 2 protein [Fredinandcohnia onubensis]
MNFSFVILHYQVHQDTIECIESILSNITYDNYNIVVVDNGSTNDSANQIDQRFKEEEKVYLIRNKENLGFAKGNNVGFMFAKKELKADFIIMINNDTIIEQKDFITRILEKHKQTNFNILGPDILTRDGVHQNPVRMKPLTEEQIILERKKHRTKIILNKLGIEDLTLSIFRFIKKITKRTQEIISESSAWQHEHENVQLHGSCLIFDKVYIQKFNGLYSNTFMYVEEEILYYIAIKENLKILYTPSIKIFHKEDASTNSVYKKESKKRLFVYENNRKSLQELLKIMNDSEYYKDYIVDEQYIGSK